MVIYVPGTEETDPKKQNMSLQQIGGATSANATSIAANTADIATNTANIATNTANISTNTAAIAKLTNNQFARAFGVGQTGLAISTRTKVLLSSFFDPSGIFDNANDRFKPSIAGYYQLNWSVCMTWTGAAAAYSQSSVQLSGIGSDYSIGAASFVTNQLESTGSDIAYFNGTTDYVELFAYMNGGASRDVVAGSQNTNFSISLVKAD